MAVHPPGRIDIVDETFIDAAPDLIARTLTHPRNTASAWPHLTLGAVVDRGVEGAIWRVTGAFAGEIEVWVEPWWEGAIVHHYVRATAEGDRAALARAHTLRWKRHVTAVKDRLEPPHRTWGLTGGQSARSLVEDRPAR